MKLRYISGFIVILLAVLGFHMYLRVSARETTPVSLHFEDVTASDKQMKYRVFPFPNKMSIHSLEAGGFAELHGEFSVVRIILIDSSGQEYLVREISSLINGMKSQPIPLDCDETCYLDSVKPVSIRLEVHNASVTVNAIRMNAKTYIADAAEREITQTRRRRELAAQKIAVINTKFKQNIIQWEAGDTEIGTLPYAEKKAKWGKGAPPGIPLANLQGLEYYKEGVFQTAEEDTDIVRYSALSSIVSSFDWRNRHGKNYITPVRPSQHTSTNRCGSCWAYAGVAAVEAGVNVFYNTLINPDLSEQQPVCAHPRSCSTGGPSSWVTDIAKNQGLVTERCLPYTATENCPGLCSNWQSDAWKVTNYINVSRSSADDIVKQNLILHGPMSMCIISMNHNMAVVGYKTDSQGRTVWIFKDSHGPNSGLNGYVEAVVPVSDRCETLIYVEKPYLLSNPGQYQVTCEDRDNDTYCNWGVGPKPANCPSSCKAEIDCDDSQAGLGPYASDFSCTPSAAVTRTPTPNVSPTRTVTNSVSPGLTSSAGTNLQVTVLLHGIGRGGDNVNPTSLGTQNPGRPQRTVSIEITDTNSQTVTKQGTVSYNSTVGNFQGTIPAGTSTTGSYIIKVGSNQYLTKTVPGIISLTAGQTKVIPAISLTTGDTTLDNRLNILDYNVILDCYADIGLPKNCSDTTKKQNADITDDSSVNQFDYNLFLRELSVQAGQ